MATKSFARFAAVEDEEAADDEERANACANASGDENFCPMFFRGGGGECGLL